MLIFARKTTYEHQLLDFYSDNQWGKIIKIQK